MKRNETITHDKTKGIAFDAPCEHCRTMTIHKVIKSIRCDGYAPQVEMYYWYEYEIVQCQGCEEISFRKGCGDSDTLEHDPKTDDVTCPTTYELFPKRKTGRKTIDEPWSLPTKVKEIYRESNYALANDLPVLTAVGTRALVEAVCKEKDASGQDLKERINNLVTLGILVKTEAEALQSMRFMGNKAAHEIESPKTEELIIAMNIVDHLLYGVYILPKAAAELPIPP